MYHLSPYHLHQPVSHTLHHHQLSLLPHHQSPPPALPLSCSRLPPLQCHHPRSVVYIITYINHLYTSITSGSHTAMGGSCSWQHMMPTVCPQSHTSSPPRPSSQSTNLASVDHAPSVGWCIHDPRFHSA